LVKRALPDYVVHGDTDRIANADESDRVQITNAKVTTTGGELKELGVSKVYDIEIVETPISTGPLSKTETQQLGATATEGVSI
jgi:hypothetical protein